MHLARATSLLLFALASAAPANADPIVDGSNVFFFAGRFQSEWVWETAAFWRDHYEPNSFMGAGYQTFFADLPANFHAGVELGAGLRLGSDVSTEVWGGFVLKNDGVTLGDFTLSPSITAGLSLVSDTVGVETQRAAAVGQNVSALFYLGPEIAVSHAALPGLEAFARIQHRSGGYGALADIDGSNAATVGVRFKL